MASQIRHSALTFRLSCWGLGLIAFGQLLVGGVALAVRFERAQVTRVEEKIVTKIVTVSAPVIAVAPPSPPPVPLPPPLEPTPLPPARPLAAPPIADPVVERLVKEARIARIADDMAEALTKLGEARGLAPKEPNVLYETGLVWEAMAATDPRLADQAADAYQEVFSLGTTGAGALYPLAAQKLRDGIALPEQLRDKLVLGRPRFFRDETFKDGERTILTIPVMAAPGTTIEANQLVMQVEFYDSTMVNGKKKILQRSDDSQVVTEWVSGELDFVGGEELLRVTYMLPPQDAQQQQLFGKRTYYGQVVKVFYKNELIDSDAKPRHLASQGPMGSAQQQDENMPNFLGDEDMIDPSNPYPLLPPIDGEPPPVMPDLNHNRDGSVPPLPSR